MPFPNAAFAALARLRAVMAPVRRVIHDVENSPVVVAAREIRARIADAGPKIEIIPFPRQEITHD